MLRARPSPAARRESLLLSTEVVLVVVDVDMMKSSGHECPVFSGVGVVFSRLSFDVLLRIRAVFAALLSVAFVQILQQCLQEFYVAHSKS